MELSQESAPATPAPETSLRDRIAEVIYGTSQWSVEHPWGQGADSPVLDDAFDTADQIVALLEETGHVLPGAPPAARILADAKRFHDQKVLIELALRVLNMLAFNGVQTPESRPARKWIEDYLQGVNHGPPGQAMLWPGKMPGMAAMLRDWGFVPTIALPGQPSYVARPLPNRTVQ